MSTTVIHHGDCLDGFCAAWLAWRKLGESASYVPAYYGQPAPEVRGQDVLVLDFSYDYATTLRIAEEAETLLVLDHHKTAEAELARIESNDRVHIVFDMNRSGAGLARDFFEPGLESWLVDYTQDRDLWRFALPESKQVNAYIGTLAQTFAAYEETHQTVSAEEAARRGAGADAYRDMYVAKLVKHARRIRFAGYDDIPVVNAPYVGISELVGALAETALFAVGWFQRGDGRVAVSLRSRGDFDVAALAQRFGGGGHKAAAGFTLDAPADFLGAL